MDFAIFDPKLGCRIACESDWGEKRDVDWAFNKLRGLKADLKILIFESKHSNRQLPTKLEATFKKYLAASHHHQPKREFYLFLQFDICVCQAFLWEPHCDGPLDEDDIRFELIS